MRFIIDAGPMLNFLATGEENCLIQTASLKDAVLCVPEQVGQEIVSVAQSNPRFRGSGAERRWCTLRESKHITVLDDDVTTNQELARELALVSGVPALNRMRSNRDLGEDLVIAHACVLARQGHQVLVLIDEKRGRRQASQAQQRLAPVASGSLTLTSTRTILEAADPSWFSSKHRDTGVLYKRMKDFDDGL